MIKDRQTLTAESLAKNPSFEAVQMELEHMFIGRLEDPSVLEGVKSEHQEQWDCMINEVSDQKVTLRVRCIDGERYVLCIKRKRRDDARREEVEVSTEKEVFDIVKSIAYSGMRKRRYFFPVPDSELLWELDVFEDAEGKPIGWVKLDLEVTSSNEPIPAFPVKLRDIINPGDRDAIDNVMDDEITLSSSSN